jgi:glutathione synthase/RimK-type ligase-like ATP-grasp enzyme
VGAIERVAAEGEWRTNIALGGTRRRVDEVPPEAEAMSLAAARAIGADLVGVDLLPYQDGYVVLELNGAVDFTPEYSLPGRNVFDRVAEALIGPAGDRALAFGAASEL